MCSVPVAELLNRSYVAPPPPLLAKVESCCEHHARCHTLRIHATDRCGPIRTATVAGWIRYHVFPMSIRSRSQCHPYHVFGSRSATYESFVRTSLITFYTKLVVASCTAPHHTFPISCTPATVRREPLAWLTVAGMLRHHLSLCHIYSLPFVVPQVIR